MPTDNSNWTLISHTLGRLEDCCSTGCLLLPPTNKRKSDHSLLCQDFIRCHLTTKECVSLSSSSNPEDSHLLHVYLKRKQIQRTPFLDCTFHYWDTKAKFFKFKINHVLSSFFYLTPPKLHSFSCDTSRLYSQYIYSNMLDVINSVNFFFGHIWHKCIKLNFKATLLLHSTTVWHSEIQQELTKIQNTQFNYPNIQK